MPHWSASPTSRRQATPRSPSPRVATTPGGTPAPGDGPPPLGIWTGLPLIPCPECGADAVEEYYVPGVGGSTTGNPPSSCRRNETGAPGGCSFFKTQDEYEAILRDRGLLGPASTPEQRRPYLVLERTPSGSLVPERVGNPEVIAAMEDLMHELKAQRLALAQLVTDIEDSMAFKSKRLGAWDKVQKVAKTESLARWAKAFVKWFFVASAVVLLLGIVVAMSVK